MSSVFTFNILYSADGFIQGQIEHCKHFYQKSHISMHSLSMRQNNAVNLLGYKKWQNPPLHCKSQDFEQRMHRMHIVLKLKSQYKILSFLQVVLDKASSNKISTSEMQKRIEKYTVEEIPLLHCKLQDMEQRMHETVLLKNIICKSLLNAFVSNS